MHENTGAWKAACIAILFATATAASANTPATKLAAAPATAAEVDPRASNEREIEITAQGPNLWHLKTKTRVVHMRLLEMRDGTYAEFYPFNTQGVLAPFAPDNELSLEIYNSGRRSISIALLKLGADGRVVSALPLPTKGPFNATLCMDEGDHTHRLKFRFPGVQ